MADDGAWFRWRPLRAIRDPKERFWAKVNKTDTCWLWTGARSKAGYGTFNLGRRGVGYRSTHMLAYEWLIGPVPEGHELDHLCRVRNCVNPGHMEPVPIAGRVNSLRGQAPAILLHVAGVCARGHPMTTENYYRSAKGKGQCRVCRREASK